MKRDSLSVDLYIDTEEPSHDPSAGHLVLGAQ